MFPFSKVTKSAKSLHPTVECTYIYEDGQKTLNNKKVSENKFFLLLLQEKSAHKKGAHQLLRNINRKKTPISPQGSNEKLVAKNIKLQQLLLTIPTSNSNFICGNLPQP